MPPKKISQADLILNKDGSVYHLNLKRENIADTIIAVGDPGRVFKVSAFFDKIDFEMNKREFITHTGTYKGKRLTVLSTGMGTDNIEIVMLELDALFNINLKTREPETKHTALNIIRLGTSGALQEEVRIGTHLVSEYAIGLDNLMSFYDLPQDKYEQSIGEALQQKLNLSIRPYCLRASDELLHQIGFDMVRGNTLTAPGFYAPQGRELRLPIRYPKFVEDLNYFHVDNFLAH